MPRTVSSWSPCRRKPPPTLTLDFAIACSRSASVRPSAKRRAASACDVQFLEIAAEGHDVGHARHLAQHAHDVPLHFGAQLVQVVAVARRAGTGTPRPAASPRARARASPPAAGRRRRRAAGRSCARRKLLMSSAKVSVISDRPNRLSLRIRVIPGVPFSSRSSGTVTRRSISSGALPGSWVITVTWVLVTSGIGLDRRVEVRAQPERGHDERWRTAPPRGGGRRFRSGTRASA